MKKLLILSFLFLNNGILFAQSGAHIPSNHVKGLFINKDNTKLITISLTEIIMWDYIKRKPIWSKKPADFGVPKGQYFSTSVDPMFNCMVIKKDNDVKTVIDLNTFATIDYKFYIQWGNGRTNHEKNIFTSDGRLLGFEFDNSKKNNNILYLVDPRTRGFEKIADKLEVADILDYNGDWIRIGKKDKKGNYLSKEELYYNVKAKKIETSKDFSYIYKGWDNIPKKDYFINFSQSASEITTSDRAKKNIITFKTANPNVKAWGYIMDNEICLPTTDENTIKVLEHKQVSTKVKGENFSYFVSYINSYDYLTGKLVDSFELMNTSEEAIALAKTSSEKQREENLEKIREELSPENQAKSRLNMIRGNYVINLQTNQIYEIARDKPVYEGGLICVLAIKGYTNQRMEFFDTLDNLDNKLKYTTIASYKTCPYCSGKGAITTSTERTVADYEYTSGRKLVETTTRTNGCGSCGGCGVIPR